jgi:succinate dehydrogenase / fumarate reductase membrane anchor subunit
MMSALKHWKVLRVTAIAAIPLTIWFVYSIVNLAGADYEIIRAWLMHPFNAVLMIVFIVVTFYHAALGNHEIIEDYVHNEKIKNCSLKLKALALLVVGAVCVYSIVKVAFL